MSEDVKRIEEERRKAMAEKRRIKLASMLRLVVRDDYKVMHNVVHLESWTTSLDNHIIYLSQYAETLSRMDRDLKDVQTRLSALIDMLTEFKVLKSEPLLNDEKEIAKSLAKIADSMVSIQENLRALRREASMEVRGLRRDRHRLVELARNISENYSTVVRRMNRIMEALGIEEEVKGNE
jgi:DNA repair ATPase RecN